MLDCDQAAREILSKSINAEWRDKNHRQSVLTRLLYAHDSLWYDTKKWIGQAPWLTNSMCRFSRITRSDWASRTARHGSATVRIWAYWMTRCSHTMQDQHIMNMNVKWWRTLRARKTIVKNRSPFEFCAPYVVSVCPACSQNNPARSTTNQVNQTCYSIKQKHTFLGGVSGCVKASKQYADVSALPATVYNIGAMQHFGEWQ